MFRSSEVMLGVSKIPDAGIGVFAITLIPEGEYPFVSEEKAPTVRVSEEELQLAPGNTRKLVKHYGVPQDDGGYLVPSDFRHIDVSWFLNHSETPNMDAKTLRTLRDIGIDEELTVNYNELPRDLIDYRSLYTEEGG